MTPDGVIEVGGNRPPNPPPPPMGQSALPPPPLAPAERLAASVAEDRAARGIGRSWTLSSSGGRPWTINKVHLSHRMVWARHTAQVRREWAFLAGMHGVPALSGFTVEATPLHKDGRSPQDVGAMAPEVKAGIDGLVDAGVIPDDTARYVPWIRYHAPRVCGVDGMELTITETETGAL